MKKLILIFAFIGVFTYTTKGQIKVHFGATTAVNSTFVLDKGLSEDPRYNSTVTYQWDPIGFSFGADLSDGFGLQLESIFAQQGQIFEVIDFAKKVVGERKIELSYVQLPLFLKFMSKSDAKARTNFSIGPQLSILTEGLETLQYAASTQTIPEGAEIPAGATLNADGTYDVPELPLTELLSTVATTEIEKFKNTEIQLAAAFGLDIDIAKNLYLSTLIRANYGITDLRNKDLVETLQNNTAKELFSRRSNLSVGIQFGLNFMFGGVRSFR